MNIISRETEYYLVMMQHEKGREDENDARCQKNGDHIGEDEDEDEDTMTS